MGKECEDGGDDCGNEAGGKDRLKKGPPGKKSSAVRARVVKSATVGKAGKGDGADPDETEDADETEVEEEKAETGRGARVVGKGRGRPKGSGVKKAGAKEKEPRVGTRSSARQ